MKTVEERFWSKVDKTGDCWLWQGATYGVGNYGATSHHGKTIGAHRKAYILSRGEITVSYKEGGNVLHKCNNKLCVNPDHLYLGSRAQNSKDILLSGSHRGYDYSQNRYKYEFTALSATTYFEHNVSEEVELIEWLQRLPHGKFSEVTKKYWIKKMKEDEKK